MTSLCKLERKVYEMCANAQYTLLTKNPPVSINKALCIVALIPLIIYQINVMKIFKIFIATNFITLFANGEVVV